MATIEQAIYSILSSASSISSVVGTRIYRVKMPDNPTLPAITFQTSYGSGIESFDGDSGLRNPIIAIDFWAKSAGAASDLAERARKILLGYSGVHQDIRIDNVLEWSHVDLFESETEIYHVSSSARFWYY